MKRDDDIGLTGDFVRSTEPVIMDDVPVYDGRDFMEKTAPGLHPPRYLTRLERQLGSSRLTKRG